MANRQSGDPLPNDLPFRIVSKAIGRGAYASILKAVPLDTRTPVFAVKFIHKRHALERGRISAKQLGMEVTLHAHVVGHAHVIEWFASGEDAVWRWIAMEYAEGGDLFDKIEADVGVPEDIAHLYFQQLVGGVSFLHSKGVAHRDLKPENLLLNESGALKIADFGLATMFEYKGQRKGSSTVCGSPPYIAAEILGCAREGGGGRDQRRGGQPASKYAPDLADIWSCGVILFVLLVGNTPWDQPSDKSWEFVEYLRTGGKSTDELWRRIPSEVLSLLRGMMSVDPKSRFSFRQVRQHPWYTRTNPLLSEEGKMSDPLSVATQMLENLRIDFSQRPAPTQRMADPDAMDVDSQPAAAASRLPSATQPETPLDDSAFDWERPSLRSLGAMSISSTQPSAISTSALSSAPNRGGTVAYSRQGHDARRLFFDALADEPSMSQFSQHPTVPLSLTQAARNFRDIVPAESLTRFFSAVPPTLLVNVISDALHQLNVPLPAVKVDVEADQVAAIRFRALDGRQQPLHGDIRVSRHHLVDDQELLDVRFIKISGDPLEWRRLFKKVVVLCRECVWTPDA